MCVWAGGGGLAAGRTLVMYECGERWAVGGALGVCECGGSDGRDPGFGGAVGGTLGVGEWWAGPRVCVGVAGRWAGP